MAELVTARCLLHQENEKLLPCITVCPVPGFKKKGFYFDEGSFDENAFNLSDIFVDRAVAKLNNVSEFRLVNIRTMFHGNCFTICSLRKWGKKWGPVLTLKTRCRVIDHCTSSFQIFGALIVESYLKDS